MARYLLCGLVLETQWELQTPLDETTDHADLIFEVVDTAPSDAAWTPAKSHDGVDGSTYLWTGTIGGHDVIRFVGLGDAWFMEPDRIVFHLGERQHSYQVEVLLLSILLAEWLERRGWLALHGAAATDDRSAVAMLGGNGRGKTSLCLALVDRGWKLLTDDLLAVRTDHGGAMAYPSFPQTRLWPPDARRVFGTTGFAKAHPAYDKLRIPLDPEQYSPDPSPLGVIYLPRRDPELTEPTFERLAGRDAVFALMHNAFSRDLSEAPDREAAWFQKMAELAHRVPVFLLGYPNDLQAIGRIAQAVIEHRNDLIGD